MNSVLKRIFAFLISMLLLQALFVVAQEIPHKKLNRECNECHSTKEWHKIKFDHSKTQFELQGQHRSQQCTACHELADFSRAESECSACHTDVHAGKIQYECSQCHTPQSWTVLDIYRVHENTTFPVMGAHSRLDCDACHFSDMTGKYYLNTDCYSCHETDYRQAQNPIHSDFGFGKKCQDCHAMFAWQPALFSAHDAIFPISSGSHAGEWESCQDCHINPGNYQDFSCLTCHEHNQAATEDEHDEVRNFVYESNACYQCHPQGQAEDD